MNAFIFGLLSSHSGNIYVVRSHSATPTNNVRNTAYMNDSIRCPRSRSIALLYSS